MLRKRLIFFWYESVPYACNQLKVCMSTSEVLFLLRHTMTWLSSLFSPRYDCMNIVESR